MRRKVLLGLGALAATLSLAVALPLGERLFGRRRQRFPYLARPIPPATYDALAAKRGWSKAELDVAPGTKLRGLVRKPSSSERPWVLFFPGNDESQLERGQGFLIALAAELDWGLAVFGYRGYDASDGKSELAGIREDAPLILQRLCELAQVKAGQVHVAGFSIGGHFAVHAARGAALRGQRAASLTLLAPVNDIVMFHRSLFEKLSAGEDYQTQPFLDGVPAPVLILQGAADATLEYGKQGRDIAAALGARAKYVEFPGVDHVPLLADARALESMRTFIREQGATG